MQEVGDKFFGWISRNWGFRKRKEKVECRRSVAKQC